MANRTITLPGPWANGAADVPGTPAIGVTYKDSAITSGELASAWAFGSVADSSKMNELLYRVSSLMQLLEQNGILPFCTTLTYPANGLCMGSDGVIYRSVVGSNIGHEPTTDTTRTYWINRDLDVLAKAWPIGSIYTNETDARNPSLIMGFGTWVQIKDRFILAAGDTYLAGTQDGEANHTLTINEMPNHSHTVNLIRGQLQSNASSYTNEGVYGTGTTGTAGGGLAHNNMPPYEVAYMWRRTA